MVQQQGRPMGARMSLLAKDFTTCFTVWEFRNSAGDSPTIAVRAAEPNDLQCQHYYQRVIWRGMARSKEEARNLAAKDAK